MQLLNLLYVFPFKSIKKIEILKPKFYSYIKLASAEKDCDI